jgi:hypothetical protein
LIVSVGLFIWKVKRDLSPDYQVERARPIIAALSAFRLAHEKFPAHPSDLVSYLPTGIIAIDDSGNHFGGSGFGFNGHAGGVSWHYNADASGKGYELRRQMRERSLYYAFDGGKAAWSLDPGDGTETKELQLPP